ncbi:hypothetical protein [Nocardia otitidiscaviarum]|uniref:hypothetical protein n=1 Tax=Nocardia otitidiscaviarum TaxID=1823 RepID=UPI0018931096|nr:hypothetical protein [Nocardia otitidiscaviarum]MBF6177583.1 hypothetical protein [Nocardia otitidiscaviarum]
MSGFDTSRLMAGTACAAACLALAAVIAPHAQAAVSPTLSVTMGGSALGAARLAAVGCPQTATARVTMPDGSPVTGGFVDFFSRLPGVAGNTVGTAPVHDGTASIPWVPDIDGQHIVSGVYYGGPAHVRTTAGYTTITTVNTGGVCA